NEPPAVGLRVRMRKPIAEIDPDLPVVGVAHERLEIGRAPRPHLAGLERKSHHDSNKAGKASWAGEPGRQIISLPARPACPARPARPSSARRFTAASHMRRMSALPG